MTEPSGQGEATLVRDGVEFDARDARLLREIDRTGSVAKASANLGRSRARALSRIGGLEDAFGSLVERQRGGSGGGGSQLTVNATRLLNRYSRLETALLATAQVPETALKGTVTGVAGELADVETALGTVRGLHSGVAVGDDLQVRIGADAITLLDPDDDPAADATSARNRLRGTVTRVDHEETTCVVSVDTGGGELRALVTRESAAKLGLQEGCDVVATWKATATRLVGETDW